VGTGHIGLPLAAVLAEAGFEVTGYDTNDELRHARQYYGARPTSGEEGLDELLARHLHHSLTLTSSPPTGQDVYIITWARRSRREAQRPSLERIRVAVQRIAPGFAPPLIILRRHREHRTTRSVVLPEIRRATQQFGLAFCPERTIEGKAIPEMRSLPQIGGGLDEEARRAEALFRLITPTSSASVAGDGGDDQAINNT